MTGHPSPVTHPVIDTHGHMGAYRNFNIPHGDAAGMVVEMDAVGIDLACVSHHSAISADYEFGNAMILDACRQFPDRFLGLCVINPNYPEDAPRVIEECFATGAFRGFKVHPELHGDYPLDGPGYRAMWEYANEHGLMVLSHSYFGGDSLATFEKMARTYPNTSVMLGHAGLDKGLDNSIALLDRVPNIYLDMTAVPRHCWTIEHLVARADITRLVWGSDTPFIGPAIVLGAALLADITPAQRRAILCDNAARILGIDPDTVTVHRPSRD